MRTTILAVAVVLGSFLVTTRAEAQVPYVYGNGAYPAQGYYGGYPNQNYYGGYPVQGDYGNALPSQYGFAPNGLGYLPQTPISSPGYAGYSRYAQYGYRRYGSGRMFGSYVPRVYSIYQPRPGGLFDR